MSTNTHVPVPPNMISGGFPEHPIIWRKFMIGGLSKQQLVEKLKQRNVKVLEPDMLLHPGYTTSVEPKQIFFVRVTMGFFGLTKNGTLEDWLYPEFFQDWSRKHLDGWIIELCEVEDGPSIAYQIARTGDENSEEGKGIFDVAHQTLLGKDKLPRMWSFEGCWADRDHLVARYAPPNQPWLILFHELLFRFRKKI